MDYEKNIEALKLKEKAQGDTAGCGSVFAFLLVLALLIAAVDGLIVTGDRPAQLVAMATPPTAIFPTRNLADTPTLAPTSAVGWGGLIQAQATQIVQATATAWPTYTPLPTGTPLPAPTGQASTLPALPIYGPYTLEQVNTCKAIVESGRIGELPRPQMDLCTMYTRPQP